MEKHTLITPAFLQGGGEMGERTRNHDWAKTPVGTPDKWPPNLSNSVSLLLNSQFPMFVWWGKELTTFYNDSYRIIAGDKHPTLLGQSGREAWSEIWNDLAPLVEKVFSGQSTWSEDLILHIKRHGFVEETYFTFSYSPVLDESGAVGGLFCACMETTEKVISKRKLEESAQNLHNIILQAPVAMCILKEENFIVDIANERMFELWGKEAAAMLHKPLFEGLPEVKGQGFEALLEGVYHTGETCRAHSVPVKLPRDGGLANVFVDFVYEPHRENDGRVSGVMAVAIEVTEQVLARQQIEDMVQQRTAELAQTNDELKRTNSELQRSNAHLEEFAHAASHDLKEPIRKIHFFTDRLKSQLSDKLSSEDERMFARVEHATQRMKALIDDLLLYSHVSQKPHEKESVDLNEKLKRIIDDLELEIAQKSAIISVGQLPVVRGYRRQLQQLFHNLLTNALKYSKPGVPPRISIGTTVVKGVEAGLIPEADYHLLTVSDNGIGFEQEYAEKVFQMFQRLHGKAEYEGTGVGLSIARKVAENHGGKITAQSKLGEGTTFSLYLPVE